MPYAQVSHQFLAAVNGGAADAAFREEMKSLGEVQMGGGGANERLGVSFE